MAGTDVVKDEKGDLVTDCYSILVGRRTHFSTPAFLKLWSADHKWSSGSVLVVLLD